MKSKTFYDLESLNLFIEVNFFDLSYYTITLLSNNEYLLNFKTTYES